MAATSPYSVSLATATASASSRTTMTGATGPKISSRKAGIFGGDPAQHRRRVEQPVVGPARADLGARRSTVDVTIRSTFLSCRSLISGPSATCSRCGSPTGRSAARPASRSRYSSATASSTMWRPAVMQIWPWCRNALQAPAELATSRSASSSTMSALLPPSSSDTRFSVRPAAAPTRRPTAVEPVKAIIATFGSSARADPASAVAGQHVQQALGQACLLEQPRDQHSAGHRRLHVRLEDHGIAQRQRWRHRPDGQDLREVPRADHPDHAERHPPRDRLPPRLAARQQVAPGLRRQRRRLPELTEHELDLEGCLAGDAAALPDQPGLEFLVVVLQDARGPPDQRRTLRAGPGRPLRLGRPSPARGLGNIRLIGQAHLGEHLAGGRLDRLQDAALSSRPAAAENPGLPFGPAEQRHGLVLSCAWLPAASLVGQQNGR